jgi:hypothetical protein
MSGGDFVGWIPNVSGHLSFSHCGISNAPSACFTFNVEAGTHRLIFCAQKRVLFDGLISVPYFRFLFQNDPTYLFVLICHSEATKGDRLGQLVGDVYVLPISHWRAPIPGRTTLLRDEVEGAIDTLDAESITRTDVNRIKAEFDRLRGVLDMTSSYKVTVHIERNGMARLSNVTALQSVRALNSIHSTGREVRDGLESEADMSFAANQAYFFLKDIFHTHKHHDAKSDTIIAAHREDQEYTWIREAHYRLHRKIVTLRRSPDIRSYYDALGLMSYVSALTKIANIYSEQLKEKPLYQNRSDNSFLDQIKHYNQKEIEDSIKSVIEFKRWRRVQKNILLTGGPAIFIGMMALAKPAAGPAADKAENLFQYASRYFTGLFAMDVPSAILLLVMLGLLPYLYGYWTYRNNPIVQTTVRILVSKPQNVHAAIYILLGTGLMGGSVLAALVAIFPGYGFALPGFDWSQPDQRLLAAKWLAIVVIALLLVFFYCLPVFVTLPTLFRRVREIIVQGVKRRVAAIIIFGGGVKAWIKRWFNRKL